MGLSDLGIKNFEIKELGSVALFKPFLEMLELSQFVDRLALWSGKENFAMGKSWKPWLPTG